MDAKRQNIYGGYTNPNPLYNQYYYQYLTVEILEDGYFYIEGIYYDDGTNEVVYYNKNNEGWVFMPDYSNPINVSKNDIIRFKSELDTSKDIGSAFYVASIYDFDDIASFNIYGNIMSLIYGDDFINNSELNANITVSPFEQMFQETKVRDASNLCLPSIHLLKSMYYGFFDGSTIEYAPKIIPAHLADFCYGHMFKNCEYLEGQITIPAPLSCPAYTLGDRPYYSMFFGIEGSNLEVLILALLNKQVSIDHIHGWFDFGPYNSYIKIKLVLPWEGVENEDPNSFSAKLKYFEEENHGESAVFTKFIQTPDVFGHIFNDIKNEEVLIRDLFAGNVLNDPNLRKIIDPLQYFLTTPLTFETMDMCEFKWMNGYVPGHIDGDVITSPQYIRDYTPINFLEYSINNGPWQSYKDGVVVPANSTISWRSSTDITSASTKYSFRLLTNGPHLVDSDLSTCRFNAYGNIMSLLSPNFETLDTIPWDNCFGGYKIYIDSLAMSNLSVGVFYNTQIQSAENLILPAINLTDGCYAGLFAESDLVISPRILPVRNPRNVTGCYTDMFRDCGNLQTCPILMLATLGDPPANGISEDSDHYTFNTCSKMCTGMFKNCSSLSVAPEIHICYVNIRYPLHVDGHLFGCMFYNTAIKQLKIFTHSSTPGSSYNSEHGDIFKNMLSNTNNVTVYCYDQFSNGWSDLYLSNIKSYIGGTNVTIENLHSSEAPE